MSGRQQKQQRPGRPSLQIIPLNDLPPPGPLDLSRSLERLDLLYRKQIQASNVMIELLSALLQAQGVVLPEVGVNPSIGVSGGPVSVAGGPVTVGGPRVSVVSGVNVVIPGVTTVLDFPSGLSNGPKTVPIPKSSTPTTIAVPDPNRLQYFLVNAGPKEIYIGFTQNPQVQPSGEPNEGIPLEPPSGTAKRGDMLVITQWIGPIYGICDSGNTSTVVATDIVSKLAT